MCCHHMCYTQHCTCVRLLAAVGVGAFGSTSPPEALLTCYCVMLITFVMMHCEWFFVQVAVGVVVYKYVIQFINMVVKGLVLEQSLVISTLLLCTMSCEVCCLHVNCLQTCEHMTAHWAIKVCVFVKFHIHIY